MNKYKLPVNKSSFERGLVTWFSRAFLLLNYTVGTSCRFHLPCKSIRLQEDILILTEKHALFLRWRSSTNFLFILLKLCGSLKSYDSDCSSREENVGQDNLPQTCFRFSINQFKLPTYQQFASKKSDERRRDFKLKAASVRQLYEKMLRTDQWCLCTEKNNFLCTEINICALHIWVTLQVSIFMTPGPVMKPLNLYGSVRAQVQVKQTIISSVYIKELQERSRKETELEIKESSIISNSLHYTTPDYICYIYALR